MTLYQKVNGKWEPAERPFVKHNNVWTGCKGAWVKRGGQWQQAYEYDVTPPNPPEITLSIHEDFDTVNNQKVLKTRYIVVGTRLPGAVNDPDARLTRVLTTHNGNPPTTQFGATWTQEPDKDWPGEPWSEWRYNEYGNHNDTSAYTYKQWPANVSAGFTINDDKDYFFTGWALDQNGNWSIATASKIHVPKASVNVPNVIVKEARFQPNSSGSWRGGGEGFQSGKLIQQKSPRSVGLWFYGNQITDSIGSQTQAGEKITVRSAQIKVTRMDDTGQANANIYLFWTEYGTTGSLPSSSSNLVKHEITKLGQLAKGQSKWFELPLAFKNNLNGGVKGMGLDYKDPDKADAFPNDYSKVISTAENLRCGELHVVWEEEL